MAPNPPFAQRWKSIWLQHVLGVPLCQKWTGRHRAVPLVMRRGAWLRIVPERGGRGLMFPADCVLFFFSCTRDLYFCVPRLFPPLSFVSVLYVSCFHRLPQLCVFVFFFVIVVTVVVIFDQCALSCRQYCIDHLTFDFK